MIRLTIAAELIALSLLFSCAGTAPEPVMCAHRDQAHCVEWIK